MYAYTVWPWRVRFILTSNHWMHQVSKLKSDADKQWLQVNLGHYHVTEPHLRARCAGARHRHGLMAW